MHYRNAVAEGVASIRKSFVIKLFIDTGNLIAPNITIKLPIIRAGLQACKALADDGAKVNMTLCFQPLQALLGAKAGATFVSPSLGRPDYIGQSGMQLIREIRKIYDNYGFKTQILAASIRCPLHRVEAALAGADVVNAIR